MYVQFRMFTPSSRCLCPVPNAYAYFQTPMRVQVQTTMAVPDACARFQTPVTTRHRQSAEQSSDRLNVSLREWCRYSSWCKCAKTHLGNRSILPFSRTGLLDTMSDHCPTSLCDPVASACYSLPETKRFRGPVRTKRSIHEGQCAQKGLFTINMLWAAPPWNQGWLKESCEKKLKLEIKWRYFLRSGHEGIILETCIVRWMKVVKENYSWKLWCTVLRN